MTAWLPPGFSAGSMTSLVLDRRYTVPLVRLGVQSTLADVEFFWEALDTQGQRVFSPVADHVVRQALDARIPSCARGPLVGAVPVPIDQPGTGAAIADALAELNLHLPATTQRLGVGLTGKVTYCVVNGKCECIQSSPLLEGGQPMTLPAGSHGTALIRVGARQAATQNFCGLVAPACPAASGAE